MKFCGEIQYDTPQGGVHSDICFNCNPNTEDREMSADYRKFLHDNLDEWLDKSNATGFFYVANIDHLIREFKGE